MTNFKVIKRNVATRALLPHFSLIFAGSSAGIQFLQPPPVRTLPRLQRGDPYL